MASLAWLEDTCVEGLPPGDRWKGRALARFAAGIAPWGVLFAVLFEVLGQRWVALSLVVAAVGVAVAPLVLRATGSLHAATHGLCAALSQSLVVGAWWLGGVTAACIPWWGACVVVATLVAGRVAGLAWALLGGLAVFGLFLAQIQGLLPPSEVPADALAFAAAAAHGGLFLVVFVLVAAGRAVNERARTELELSRLAAEHANHAKSDFLARMSHELRTPLNAVLGYAELLAEDATPEVARDLDQIRAAGNHLLSVVNDVLDLAKVEAGRLQFETRDLPVRDLLASVAATASPLVAVGRNRLVLDADPAIAARADELRLRQCVMNLVSNAAKFTREGEIRLRAARDVDRVTIEVADTGIGMTPDQLARVFEPFAQATEDIARTHGGTGLGLAIVRQYAERMGGGVAVRSEPARGSVFTLTLPAAHVQSR